MIKIKKWLNKKLPLGSFARNVVTLMTGTTFAQALLILIAPILTRLYTPEDYGVFSLYTSILGIITVIVCLRYELAIVIPEKDKDAANVVALSILITIGLSLMVLILVVLYRHQFANVLGAPKLVFWLWFLPINIFLAGLYQTLNYWSIRRKQFKRLAVRQITQSTITAATQVSSGMISYIGVGGLIGGSIAGQAAATGKLTWEIWKDEGKELLSNLSKERIKINLVRYKQFPIFSSWSSLLNTASILLPALLLGYFFTPAVVGYYALGNRILKMPMKVIGGAVSKAFYPKATEAQKKGELDRVTFNIFKQLVAIGLVPILLITIVAPELFYLVFGEDWIVAGEYVRWISLWMLLVFISSPLSTVYFVMDRQRTALFMDILMFCSRLIVLVLGGLSGDASLTVALFGISGAILWLINCIYIMYLSGVKLSKVILVLIIQSLRSIPYIIVPIITLVISKNPLFCVLTAIFVGMIFLIREVKSIVKKGDLV